MPSSSGPAVSVVIPCYNAGAYLAEAIASVRAQRRPADEIIVVDDCSTDGSAERAVSLGARCLTTGQNSGPSRARNLGVQAAQGDIVAFLDADDWWEPGHVAAVAGLLERFPEAGVAFSMARASDDAGRQSARFIPENQPTDVFWICVRNNIVPQLSAAVRREAFQSVGGYNESMRYSEDYDLWLRLARRWPFVCTYEVTANYRAHGAQVSQRRDRILRGVFEAQHRLLESLRREDEPNTQRLASEIRHTWQNALAGAWRSRDREYLRAALDLADLIPGGPEIKRRWRWRVRLLWPAWMAATRVWDRVPPEAQRVMRSPLRQLFGLSRRAPEPPRESAHARTFRPPAK